MKDFQFKMNSTCRIFFVTGLKITALLLGIIYFSLISQPVFGQPVSGRNLSPLFDRPSIDSLLPVPDPVSHIKFDGSRGSLGGTRNETDYAQSSRVVGYLFPWVDLSGNDYQPTRQNNGISPDGASILLFKTGGAVGSAGHHNGRGQNFILPHRPDIAGTEWTIEMLIKPLTGGTGWRALVSKATNSSNYSIMCALDPNDYLACYTNAPNLPGAAGWYYSNTPVIEGCDNGFAHVAMSVGNCQSNGLCQLKLYINGVKSLDEHNRHSNGRYINFFRGVRNTGDLRIGAWFGTAGDYNSNPSWADGNFHGYIDTFLMWNRALNDDVIRTHAFRSLGYNPTSHSCNLRTQDWPFEG